MSPTSYLLLINAAAFLFMLLDKKNAIHRSWRVPELVLLLCAILGGSLGAAAAMYLLRHKTRKPLFSIGLPVLLAIHLLIVMLHVT